MLLCGQSTGMDASAFIDLRRVRFRMRFDNSPTTHPKEDMAQVARSIAIRSKLYCRLRDARCRKLAPANLAVSRHPW